MPEPPAVSAGPAPDFAVLGVDFVPYSAVPTLRFEMQAIEPAGREVYTIALKVQINVDPVRRAYDEQTRERLVALFGAPERWGATTHSFLWQHVEVLVPSFTGDAVFELIAPCTFDQEIAATRYFTDLPDGEAPLSFHFSGTVMYPAGDGRLQMVQVPWDRSARFGLPVAKWRAMIEHHYPHGGWIALHEETIRALQARRAQQGAPTMDVVIEDLLREAGDE